MARVLSLAVTLLTLLFSNNNFVNTKKLSEINGFYNIKYEYGKEYTIEINKTSEYVFEYSGSEYFESEYPARISVTSNLANRTYPVFITARQQKGVLSWQLPSIAEGNQEYPSISRTLCPNKNFFLQPSNTSESNKDASIQNHPIIHVYTSSAENLIVVLQVDMVRDFYLSLNSEKNFTTSPSKPIIYFYSFEYGALDGVLDLEKIGSWRNSTNQSENLVGDPINNSSHVWDLARNVLRASIFNGIKESLKTVLIRIDSNDDICMLVSIQNATCPVFDTERDVAYEGFYATMSRRGGITVTQSKYPLGFYIVLLVMETDEDCSSTKTNNVTHFANFFSWQVEDFARFPENTRPNGRMKDFRIRLMPSITYQQYWVAIVVALAAIFLIYLVFLVGLICHKSRPKNMDVVDAADIIRENEPSTVDSPVTACSALDVATNNFGIQRRISYSSLGEVHEAQQVFLSELCRRDTQALERQSSMFLWHLLTVAVFYGLPVVQLVITYQRVLNQTGNQDQCYYNFLCAHPLGLLSDFNHVYSNLGYIMLGILFIVFVWRKRCLHSDPMFDKFYGIPQHHGLYYAMGVALMMEGILSGSYHVCPNHTNFQFDTSFMYVIAVLCMVKIYQTRHPDINARAHLTFGVLAAAVFIGLIGVLYPNFYFWVVFTVLHIATCLVLTLQIYYLGRLNISWSCCSRCMCGGVCHPAFRSRCVLVLLANCCNWALAGYGLYEHSKDFATHLLYIFLMNLALHFFWYLTMKLVHRETILWHAWVLLLLSMVTWGGALRFFFDNSISWAMTPAQSRTFNKPCGILDFYDNHDIWHFLSAAAMFLSFMLLLIIDDDLTHRPRSKIPVF